MKRYIIAALALLAIPALAAEIDSLDAVDASNTARFPENMSPGAVNDGARALEGIVARWSQDESCSIASAGSSSVWTLSATRTLTGYYDGLKMCFDAHTANDGSVTLNVDSLGAVTLKKENDENLAAGDIEAGQKVEVVYDGANFQILSPVVGSSPDDLITTRGDLIYGDSSADAARLAVGGADQFLGSDGTDVAWESLPVASTTVSGVQENADQSDMESLASTRTVTPDQVVASPYAAKGFVRFVVSGSAIDSYVGQNVASVTYESTGDFTVEWDTDFSAATYTCTATTEWSANFYSPRLIGITAGASQIKVTDQNNVDRDPTAVNVICFGDQ